MLIRNEAVRGRADAAISEVTRRREDTPPYDTTHSSVPTSVEAQDRFLDLPTATWCEVAVDANALEPSFLQYAKRTDVVRGRSGVQRGRSAVSARRIALRSRCLSPIAFGLPSRSPRSDCRFGRTRSFQRLLRRHR